MVEKSPRALAAAALRVHMGRPQYNCRAALRRGMPNLGMKNRIEIKDRRVIE
jgi:hypothetical protein